MKIKILAIASLAIASSATLADDSIDEMKKVQKNYCKAKYAFLLDPTEATATKYVNARIDIVNRSQKVADFLEKMDEKITKTDKPTKKMGNEADTQVSQFIKTFVAKCPDMK